MLAAKVISFALSIRLDGMGTVQHHPPSVAVPLSITGHPSSFLKRRQRRGQDIWDAHKRTKKLGFHQHPAKYPSPPPVEPPGMMPPLDGGV
ncbi:hypothetical protein HanRHA438_Chr03g0107531 [Helianthus annuus]|uniref:Uncharacterized protein n=1 Tax=Helianthus annuus TaxID=4232 RepID=A0A251TVU8_HELAN|nr:hypothetical protein HanXRQr2_Chr03g0096481 [Helianthus annuus]KAJ0599474.1 hypothetical protein HanIR_Chr03g0105291 [Helianthus annuus]KAJ0607042.1 hypothetical protein HanHA89_Chr03g0091961 [Helianthus annuus]KAJ0934445.1 hypothetical protein HanRHA438_Chr03g0107531 [Helianthus annuus]KAJ0942527.1 hypothetical protein HanPSC8_Chr03g0093021 [Helianthus annuus]